MASSPNLTFDVASAVAMGKRDTQEDAIVADFPMGGGLGLIVLADGMGGHNAGDIASKIVVTEVYSTLKMRGVELTRNPAKVAETLRRAAASANRSLAAHAETYPKTDGMGATLVGLVQIQDALFWISIGDSVLYLLRDGKMRKLNEDHSLAPQIDYMVRRGLIPEDVGRNHPDRNCLTSALRGEDIPQIDCPEKPLRLMDGDVILAASDGLPFLGESRILGLLAEGEEESSADLAGRLLEALDLLDHPEQDNVCFSVIRVTDPAAVLEEDEEDFEATPEVAPPPARQPQPAEMEPATFFGMLRGFGHGILK